MAEFCHAGCRQSVVDFRTVNAGINLDTGGATRAAGRFTAGRTPATGASPRLPVRQARRWIAARQAHRYAAAMPRRAKHRSRSTPWAD